MREWAGWTLWSREEGTEGIDTEKERIICLIHERLWLSARSSRRVPPLMVPSPSPLFFLPLSFYPFFCFVSYLLQRRFNSLAVLIFSVLPVSSSPSSRLPPPPPPPPPLLPLFVSSLLPLWPISPLLSLPLYPQLISSSCLICCPFQFNIFQPCLLPNACVPALTHTHFSYPFTPSLCVCVCVSLSLWLSLSGVGSALPSPPEHVLPLLYVRLTSWGHDDLSYPLSGITITFVL